MTEHSDRGPGDLDVYRGESQSRLAAIKEYFRQQEAADD